MFDAFEADGLLIGLASTGETAWSRAISDSAVKYEEAAPAMRDGAVSIDELGTNPDEEALEGTESFAISLIAPDARLS